jgi:hypothetical protein
MQIFQYFQYLTLYFISILKIILSPSKIKESIRIDYTLVYLVSFCFNLIFFVSVCVHKLFAVREHSQGNLTKLPL